jgi:hypothetical protein
MSIGYKSTLTFSLILCSFLNCKMAAAVDLQQLQNECADLGLKIGTLSNGKCVLKLRKKAMESEKKEAYLQEQQTQNYRAQQIKEAEMMDLQRRSVAAQEELAKAQDRAATNNMLFNGIQMLRGSGPYYQPQPAAPRAPISCLTMPNGMISCQ